MNPRLRKREANKCKQALDLIRSLTVEDEAKAKAQAEVERLYDTVRQKPTAAERRGG